VSAPSRVIDDIEPGEARFDFETVFHVHYERIARVIARVVGDPARAEELAVEVFWKLWRNPGAQGDKAGGWLYRGAVRLALDELRRQNRRQRYEWLLGVVQSPANPEEAHAATEEQRQVRRVLATLGRRDAGLLLLRGNGLSYSELASALELNPASIGTLVSRAQQAFRKEYERQYGKQRNR
jgi:RNA polymerase sigma-70 factor, ECF subfamily